MANRVIYLEIDDEITSAAARIRAAEAPRVAVVLPYGSRVATSRINFRLLSRDAQMHDKRLAIVAGESATRALAASAGLPVFGSVAEYEASLRGEDPASQPGSGGAGVPVAGGVVAAADAVGAGDLVGLGARSGSGSTGSRGAPAAVAAAGATGAAQADPGIRGASLPSNGSRTQAAAAPAPALAPVPAETVRADVARTMPQAPGIAGPSAGTLGRSRTKTTGRSDGARPRTTLIVGAAILALAGLVALVGAYLLLPSADIGVTPQPERIAPLELTVVADPAATEVDPAGLVVPATSVSTDASANGTFPATGKRVEETKATGVVRFENLDFLNSNTVPGGSIVGTNAGVRFRTIGSVTVPKADIVGLSLFPGKISVKVTAVKAGEDGNVDANTIVVVPAGEEPIALKVTNPQATKGGTHQEFPRVTQQDIDLAMSSLGTQLDEAFRTKLTDPSLAPPGSTLFPETAVLGEATPTVDPATLVGQEIESFDLGLTATGTALAVDTDAVRSLADTQLAGKVEPDHVLVPESVEVTVGDGSAAGQTVLFPVTASAEQIAVLDGDKLKALILGKSVPEAKAILAPYGTVNVSVWPDWMGSVPSLGSRVTLTVDKPERVERPSSSVAPSRAPARTAPATASTAATPPATTPAATTP